MKLPAGCKIIGVIVADGYDVEGSILWDNWWMKNTPPLARKDILNDIRGLAETQYNSHDIFGSKNE